MNEKVIWVLGSSNIDMTYFVEKLPRVGQTITAHSFLLGTGGKGANQAIAASHFGPKVNFIGAVGDDGNGQVLLDILRAYKIDTQNVHIAKNHESGNAIIFVDNSGDNFISVYPGANDAIPISMFENVDFYKEDILIAQLEVNIDAVETGLKIARSKNVTTILNPSPYKNIGKELLKNTDILIANETEAHLISNIVVNDVSSAKKAALMIRKLGVKKVIVTLGEQGVVVTSADTSLWFPGHKINVVDTQGAGDAFLGAFVSQIYNGESFVKAVSLANYIAAVTVTTKGSTQISLPDIGNIDMNYNKSYTVL